MTQYNMQFRYPFGKVHFITKFSSAYKLILTHIPSLASKTALIPILTCNISRCISSRSNQFESKRHVSRKARSQKKKKQTKLWVEEEYLSPLSSYYTPEHRDDHQNVWANRILQGCDSGAETKFSRPTSRAIICDALARDGDATVHIFNLIDIPNYISIAVSLRDWLAHSVKLRQIRCASLHQESYNT